MRVRHALAFAALACAPAAASAQVSIALGAGSGVGSRGATSGDDHLNASLEFRLPVLTAAAPATYYFTSVRTDAYYLTSPNEPGRVSAVASVVLAARVPAVTPYVLAGWGAYGIDDAHPMSGWNVGVGARAPLPRGPAIFAEFRRHERFVRDIVTVGVRF